MLILQNLSSKNVLNATRHILKNSTSIHGGYHQEVNFVSAIRSENKAVFPLAIGFLFDTRNPQNSSNQFITASEFFEAKSGLQNGIEETRYEANDLRHDVDRKLMLLTSQVQQMFDSLQQQIPQKETNRSDEIEQKYQELSQNYTDLQKRFDLLQANQIGQLNKLFQCKDKVNKHDREISALMNLKTTFNH
ncbi:unnamed protein product [Mytilus coruscus]|uniref:Uncharacterized protein n=1 Tax=Mytilus coruscus TaxID=42192 RepID=A0A6J8A0Z1_MYTCO|nr:unnamed protein product [Mytilus coruscus]